MSKIKSGILVGSIVLSLFCTGCSSKEIKAETSLPKVDMTRWLYSSKDDVYYQTGIQYVEKPVDLNYETFGIFVPGNYFDATDNGDGTFTVTVNSVNKVNGYTSSTAPIVIPVNTPGYSAMSAPKGYSGEVASYTSQGFVYFNPGCRGRNEGAPAGITDLKAAIRYYRYCKDILPGNTDRIFSFGMSGGGAQSALLGATGDSELYEPYLESIGAVKGVSDAICGSMDWCPITNLDVANEAYEWNMGLSRTDLSTELKDLSVSLAQAFADAVNKMGLKDDNGNALTLEQSDDGMYQAGSYYEWIKSEIERSLNNFLKDTSFPYDSEKASGSFGFGMGHGPMGGAPGMDGGMPPDGGPMGMGEGMDFTQIDQIMRQEAKGTVEIKGVYETPSSYIDALNSAGHWVDYDEKTNTVKISSIEAFAKAVKPATKSVGAFDDLNSSQGENTLFGDGDGKGKHWDKTMAALLKGTEYEESYESDCKRVDALGKDLDYRINMYTPLYYLLKTSDGYKKSTVAKYWRIRTGIFQGDTSVTTEASLAQVLKNYGIKDVDFEMVWGMKHVEAERTGNNTENFIAWVNSCLK